MIGSFLRRPLRLFSNKPLFSPFQDTFFADTLVQNKIVWDMEKVQPIIRNIYAEHPNITARNPSQVEEFYQEHEILLSGTQIKPVMSLEQCGFDKKVINTLQQNKIFSPTPIQSIGWPNALAGKDIVGIAKTGSGKTLSYILPAIDHIKNQRRSRIGEGPVTLVIAPTRELAMQISEQAFKYSKLFNIQTACLYGGGNLGYQKKLMRMGSQLVVTTPGRMIDFLRNGTTNLSRTSFIVIDEADRILDIGLEPQLRGILSQARPDRQTLMWSATWPRQIQTIASEYQNQPVKLKVGGQQNTANSNIQQEIMIVNQQESLDLLCSLLQKLINQKKKVLVFTETIKGCQNLERYLTQLDISAMAIHGQKTQDVRFSQERISVIKWFRRVQKGVLVATDVAARGLGKKYLDIRDITHVLNYDMPKTIEDYIHRIGRTARQQAKGNAISFFKQKDIRLSRKLVELMRMSKQHIPDHVLGLQNSFSYAQKLYKMHKEDSN